MRGLENLNKRLSPIGYKIIKQRENGQKTFTVEGGNERIKFYSKNEAIAFIERKGDILISSLSRPINYKKPLKASQILTVHF